VKLLDDNELIRLWNEAIATAGICLEGLKKTVNQAANNYELEVLVARASDLRTLRLRGLLSSDIRRSAVC
jgi:hypothetical protein